MMIYTVADLFASAYPLRGGLRPRLRSSQFRFGEHASYFHNQGYDFYQLSEYDHERHTIHQIVDVDGERDLVYEFDETRAINIVFCVDVSRSMSAGFADFAKERLLLEALGILGLTAVHEKDPMRTVAFAQDVIFTTPIRANTNHVYYTLRRIYDFFRNTDATEAPLRSGTNIYALLKHLRVRLKGRSVVVILSDFIGYDAALADVPQLKNIAARHDVLVLFIDYQKDLAAARGALGSLPLRDSETGKIVDVSRRKIAKMQRRLLKDRDSLRDALEHRGIMSEVLTYGDHQKQLATFLAKRGAA